METLYIVICCTPLSSLPPSFFPFSLSLLLIFSHILLDSYTLSLYCFILHHVHHIALSVKNVIRKISFSVIVLKHVYLTLDTDTLACVVDILIGSLTPHCNPPSICWGQKPNYSSLAARLSISSTSQMPMHRIWKVEEAAVVAEKQASAVAKLHTPLSGLHFLGMK